MIFGEAEAGRGRDRATFLSLILAWLAKPCAGWNTKGWQGIKRKEESLKSEAARGAGRIWLPPLSLPSFPFPTFPSATAPRNMAFSCRCLPSPWAPFLFIFFSPIYSLHPWFFYPPRARLNAKLERPSAMQNFSLASYILWHIPAQQATCILARCSLNSLARRAGKL